MPWSVVWSWLLSEVWPFEAGRPSSVTQSFLPLSPCLSITARNCFVRISTRRKRVYAASLDGGENGSYGYFRAHFGAWVTTGISSSPWLAASVTMPSVPLKLMDPFLVGWAWLHSTGVLTDSAPAAAMFP